MPDTWEWFYTAGSTLDWYKWCSWWKALVSIPLSQNGFTMLTHVSFLAFTLSVNILLMLLTSWILALYAQSVLCLANHMCIAWQHLFARPNKSIVLTLFRKWYVSNALKFNQNTISYLQRHSNRSVFVWGVLLLLMLGWWKLVTSLLMNANEPGAHIYNTANGLIKYFAGISGVSWMASHLICGQTIYYIPV